jgi:hypothetical protein
MPHVTDHAIVRHLERAYGLDVDAIRAEICSPVVQLAEGFGCGTVIGKNGTRVIIRDGCVSTVLPKKDRKTR